MFTDHGGDRPSGHPAVTAAPDAPTSNFGSGSDSSDGGGTETGTGRPTRNGSCGQPAARADPSSSSSSSGAARPQQRRPQQPSDLSPLRYGCWSDAVSVRSLASIGMGSTDGRKLTIAKVPTSPAELLNLADPQTWVLNFVLVLRPVRPFDGNVWPARTNSPVSGRWLW